MKEVGESVKTLKAPSVNWGSREQYSLPNTSRLSWHHSGWSKRGGPWPLKGLQGHPPFQKKSNLHAEVFIVYPVWLCCSRWRCEETGRMRNLKSGSSEFECRLPPLSSLTWKNPVKNLLTPTFRFFGTPTMLLWQINDVTCGHYSVRHMALNNYQLLLYQKFRIWTGFPMTSIITWALW